jgi:23S rRNA pseudouridine955/2504/2580 synthase
VKTYLGSRAVRNGFVASPAHRLDRETSGVVLVAKRRPAMVKLSDAFARGAVQKRYLALVRGAVVNDAGTIDVALEDLSKPRGHVQSAVTEYRVMERLSAASLVECAPRTGRTHQLRRHLALLGHPIVADTRYGDASFNRHAREAWGLQRLFLHALSLEAPHPRDGKPLRVDAPLPADLVEALSRARA